MTRTKVQKSCIEPLEARIAPATVVNHSVVFDAKWRTTTVGSPIELHAGEGLSTLGDKSGSYLLYIEKGNALVFTTDLNNNNRIDTNEITGIAAGDGLRLISFVDIHGDIVTNLVERTVGDRTFLSLTDSDRNSSNDDPRLQGDGRVILPNTIEKVEFRPLAIEDIPDQNNIGSDDNSDGIIDGADDTDLALRTVPWSSYSVFGSIIAGGGFGASDGGLLMNAPADTRYVATVDAIFVGSAVSGKYFSFGASSEYIAAGVRFGDDINGVTLDFTPARGSTGASINRVLSLLNPPSPFNIGTLQAGDGGIGAPGGDILNVTLNADDTGGYNIIAGNGGSGPSGGDGGSITNFSDIGSSTGYIYIKSGDGGFGATGRGGNGGEGDYGTLNLRGDTHIILGDGGSGFTSGGNGASLAKAVFTEPGGFVEGSNGLGTTHYPSSKDAGHYNANNIGTHMTLDFDNDGFGDFVYITSSDAGGTISSSELVVLLGAPQGAKEFPGYRTVTAPDGTDAHGIYLQGVRNPKALATGDVNGDGHPDIVTASNDAGGSGDLVVYLAKFEDSNGNGLSGAEDLNHNGVDDFIGFWEPRHSTVPIISGGTESMSIEALTVGDFNGDGRPEIVAGVSFRGSRSAVFLTQDMEYDPVTLQHEYTGQFYADYGTKAVRATVGGRDVSVDALTFVPYYSYPGSELDLEASPLDSSGADHDVLFIGARGDRSISVIDWHIRSVDSTKPQFIGSYNMGGDFFPPTFSIIPFALHDFTVVDLDKDGIADLGGITVENEAYWWVNWSLGDGVGGSKSFEFAAPPFEVPLNTIRSMDADGDGYPNEVLVLSSTVFYGIFLGNGFVYNDIATLRGTVGDLNSGGFVDSRPIYTGSFTATVTAADSTSQARESFFLDGTPTEGLRALVDFGLKLNAGSGGDSQQGRGGTGGFLGGKSSLVSVIDPFTGQPLIDPATGQIQKTIVGAIDITTTFTSISFGGQGGDGFSRGGTGGFVSGVVVHGGSGHKLLGGDGGRGVSAAGGAGGSLVSNSLESISIDPITGIPLSPSFIAGNGGSGRFGGAGGSVIGNGTGLFDAQASAVDVQTGSGGLGLRGGGNAGNISAFLMDLVDTGGAGSYIHYVAGKGGDTVFGKGGSGGSILNSSPASGAQITGEINVLAGDGGKGLKGGDGGSVVNFATFVDGSNVVYNPSFVSFLAGNGGSGTAGIGGNGGNVRNIETPTFGDPDAVPDTYRFVFSRAIAGAGGASAGSRGGDGGSVSNIITSSQRGAWAFIGGAGGRGLHNGGAGGGVDNVAVALGASTFSKALFIGGLGGKAGSFIPNIEDPAPNQHNNQFGGRVGRGGDGGSISGITQSNAIATHIDLIAGDGGDSIHYGTPLDKPKTTYVGKGGSIRDVSLAGEAGNMDAAVGIKSYNNVFADETVADFVRKKLVEPVGGQQELTDLVGNVGVVVGAAGRNKSVVLDPFGAPITYRSLSARYGVNGSLENFTARNLMSAVAGNVDRIASIQFVKGLNIAQSIGVDKLGGDYLDQSGAPTVSHEPILDGINIDGAVIAKKYLSAAGLSVPPPQNGYIR